MMKTLTKVLRRKEKKSSVVFQGVLLPSVYWKPTQQTCGSDIALVFFITSEDV